MKTSELSGHALDWAVAKCEGFDLLSHDAADEWVDCGDGRYSPSFNWAQGGPIIEREKINLRAIRKEGHPMDGLWLAAYDHGNTGSLVQWVKREDWKRHYLSGPTPLVAAMRCFVASKLGDEVAVPEELL